MDTAAFSSHSPAPEAAQSSLQLSLSYMVSADGLELSVSLGIPESSSLTLCRSRDGEESDAN